MKILLAVSGGIDSMYLANRASAEAGALFGLNTGIDCIAVAHCNFNLRGKDSDEDERFVSGWCREHGITCFVNGFDTAAYASGHGISIEMAARELRYTWFGELCSSEGFDAVAVAHNANDNAETLFLNLLRGTGLRGICGMSPDSVVMTGKGHKLRILRPLLSISRDEIRSWMELNGKVWREDRSNAENTYKRNRIRNEVFPILRQMNPSFLNTLSEDMKHFSQAASVADTYFRHCQLDPDRIDIQKLKDSEHWEYLLYRLTEGRLNTDQYKQLLSCLGSGKQISGKRFGPYVASSNLLIFPDMEENKEEVPYKIVDISEIDCLKQPKGNLILDADKLHENIVFRHWRDGDWMVPFGMKGRKKLSDIFSDLHFSIPEKESAILLEHPDDPSRIAAIVGVRIDDSMKVTEQTEKVMIIR